MSGSDIAAEVHGALLEVGQNTGQGELTVMFRREGARDESTFPPTMGEPSKWAGRAMQEMIAGRDKDGTNVRDGDTMLIVSALIETIPQNGDKVTVAGNLYSVEMVEPYSPGGVTLYYMVRARGA